MERALSKTLQREVLFNQGPESGAATVRFFGGLKVKLPQVQRQSRNCPWMICRSYEVQLPEDMTLRYDV